MRSEMRAHYPADQPLMADVAFLEWVAKLEDIMRAWGAKYGNLPYDLPLAEGTGLECWHDSYKDEMTPQEAFDSDQSYWEAE